MKEQSMQENRARRRERPEPHEANAGIPWYVVFLILASVVWGAWYLATAPQQRDLAVPETVVVDGDALFNAQCAACHQGDGRGIAGAFPPLAGAEWVTGEPQVLVAILLHGLVGRIEVAGNLYNGVMPGFGRQLTDAQIAAIASHVRTSWGNDAGPVDAVLVAAERARMAERDTPFQGQDELEALFDGD